MTISLEEMIEKRHPAPGWVTMFEVANATGYRTKRHADAVALGIWPSHGHELHGFEVKRSRSDVQKELSDPAKADAIGEYVDHWWLVVGDLKIIDGIVVPATWGILYPRGQVLRVHRKAPKRKAKAVDRGFSAAMIRNVIEGWVPKRVHDELKKTAKEEAMKQIANDKQWELESGLRDLADLRVTIKRFEEASGVNITQHYGNDDERIMSLSSWEIDKIGEAVKIVREAREAAGRTRFHGDDPVSLVKGELHSIEHAIRDHETAIGNRRAAADRVRELLARLDTSKPAQPVQLPFIDQGFES